MNWIRLLGEHQRVEVAHGDFSGTQGTVLESWIDADKGTVSYVVLLDSGVRERIAHNDLIGLNRKANDDELPESEKHKWDDPTE